MSSLAAVGLGLSAPIANAQTPTFGCPVGSACTDPVGYTTMVVKAGGLSLLGLNLLQAIDVQATLNVDGDRTVVLPQGIDLTNGEFGAGTHFIEILAGAADPVGNAGLIATITGQDDGLDTLTLEEALPGSVPDGVSFRIRKHWTLEEIFGDGSVENPVAIKKGTDSSADRVLLLNAQGSFDTFYFKSFFNVDTGWLKIGDDVTDQGGKIVNFLDGIVVQSSAASDTDILLLGAVKPDTTIVPINTGLNVVSNVYPVDGGITLGNSGLEDFLKKGTDSSADRVLLLNDQGGFDTYYFKRFFNVDTGWLLLGGDETDRADVALPISGSYVIQRTDVAIGVALNPPAAFGN